MTYICVESKTGKRLGHCTLETEDAPGTVHRFGDKDYELVQTATGAAFNVMWFEAVEPSIMKG